jgi:signal transduction histidine kinase
VAEQSQARRDRGLSPFSIELDVAEEHLIHADPAMIRRIFAALLANAMDAADHDTSVREVPRLREIIVTSVAYADAIEIEVADSGPGLPAHAKARLFDPDFTTKPEEFGPLLVEARTIVERLGGTLHAADCPDGGTAFTFRMPHRMARRMAA